MKIISNKQTELLYLLSKYKFLSVSQFYMLGFCENSKTIYDHLAKAKRITRPFIDELKFGIIPKIGALESVYYLTKRGVSVLEDLNIDPDTIRYPKGSVVYSTQDYSHRKSTINFHILLEKWVEQNNFKINFIDFYFDKAGNNRRGKTGGTLKALTRILIDTDEKTGKELYILPDAVFSINDGNTDRLYLFEMVNGKDTKRVLEQITRHQYAINKGTPTEKYEHKHANRVILLFEQEATKNAVIKRANELNDYSSYKAHFLLKTCEELQQDFFNNWQNFDGQRVNLY